MHLNWLLCWSTTPHWACVFEFQFWQGCSQVNSFQNNRVQLSCVCRWTLRIRRKSAREFFRGHLDSERVKFTVICTAGIAHATLLRTSFPDDNFANCLLPSGPLPSRLPKHEVATNATNGFRHVCRESASIFLGLQSKRMSRLRQTAADALLHEAFKMSGFRFFCNWCTRRTPAPYWYRWMVADHHNHALSADYSSAPCARRRQKKMLCYFQCVFWFWKLVVDGIDQSARSASIWFIRQQTIALKTRRALHSERLADRLLNQPANALDQ